MKHNEDDLQALVMQWLDLVLPPEAFAWHVPNGGKRSKITATRLKRLGVRAGIPDVHILHRGRLITIELKDKGKKPSPVQRDMHQRLTLCGAIVVTLDSFDAVRSFVRQIIDTREAA